MPLSSAADGGDGICRGDYAITMALTAGVSMVVSSFHPLRLGYLSRELFNNARLTGAVFDGWRDVKPCSYQYRHILARRHICADSAGFGVAMSRALAISLRAEWPVPRRYRAGLRSSLWIWLAAILGISAMNMLIGDSDWL